MVADMRQAHYRMPSPFQLRSVMHFPKSEQTIQTEKTIVRFESCLVSLAVSCRRACEPFAVDLRDPLRLLRLELGGFNAHLSQPRITASPYAGAELVEHQSLVYGI